MNILPKKRWHVRTKENIARVRRDEAKAAEEEKARKDRAKLAEREARRQLLLKSSKSKFITQEYISLNDTASVSEVVETPSTNLESNGHINFFQEVEEGTAELKQTNKEHAKEVKEEKEKYEKQIGYLTYLGQDTNEALGKKSWYEEARKKSLETGEVNLKSKKREDPLNLIKKLIDKDKKAKERFENNEKVKEYKHILSKHSSRSGQHGSRKRSLSSDAVESDYRYKREKKKNRKHHRSKQKKSKIKDTIKNSSDSDSESSRDDESSNSYKGTKSCQEKQNKLALLRAERLKREKEEKRRTEELMDKVKGNSNNKKASQDRGSQKYNSQFNPELAKQNFDYKY